MPVDSPLPLKPIGRSHMHAKFFGKPIAGYTAVAVALGAAVVLDWYYVVSLMFAEGVL